MIGSLWFDDYLELAHMHAGLEKRNRGGEMSVFYSVDRAGTLQPGRVLDLERHADVDPVVLQEHLDSLFPDGVTRHGDQYFVSSGNPFAITDPAIELIWETVRRARFSSAPSRYQSTFATEDIDSARQFRDQFGQGNGSIWTVEATASFRADMALLQWRSALCASYFADLYWSHRQHPELPPMREVLLTPPVRVIERVE